MGKRSRSDKGGNGNKKFKSSGFIDPGTKGIYATCMKGKESQCKKELLNLFSQKLEEYYDLDALKEDADDEDSPIKKDGEVDFEDEIRRELAELKENTNSKKEFLRPVDLGCGSLVFVKTRRPIEPDVFVEKICQECLDSKEKSTRYTQKLTPIVDSVSASLEELRKLAAQVLAPHFHKKEDQEPLKFAIQVTKRNFNVISRDEIIKNIAECVGRDHGHKVDLKNYDKLILVECFKSNIGMSVANNYEKLERYNLQQIYEKNSEDSGSLSRVNPKEAEKDIK